jgi:hypothetical protein
MPAVPKAIQEPRSSPQAQRSVGPAQGQRA